MKHAEGWPQGARHCLRIGAMSDKAVIEAAKDSFEVLVLQGNLAISAPQGLGSWLEMDKPFWIDPITYAFAANPKFLRAKPKGGTPAPYKRTFERLAERYGEPFQSVLINDSQLRPENFTPDLIRESAERVLSFQQTVLTPPAEDTKYGITETLEPCLVTVPFFPLQPCPPGQSPAWQEVNLGFIEACAGILPSSRLAAAMLIEPDLLDEADAFQSTFNAYIDRLTTNEITNLWLWVSENEETRMSSPRGVRLLRIIDAAQERGINVHQAFGGSFSTFALSRGLTSVSHGVNYWESKSWEPLASGGLPVARYFYPPLRERLRVPDAIAALDSTIETPSDFHEIVCSCPTCLRVVVSTVVEFGLFGEVNIKRRRTRGGGTAEFDSPTPEALMRTKTHYLQAKGIEVSLALSSDFNPVQVLREDAERHASDVTRTSHLETWARAFQFGSRPSVDDAADAAA